MNGHAVEARVYAEDPARGFLPTGGTVLALREPTGDRTSASTRALAEGTAVSSHYDPMLAKVIAWGPDRATALRRLDGALASTTLLGVTTNIAFLRELLARSRRPGGAPRHRPGRTRRRGCRRRAPPAPERQTRCLPRRRSRAFCARVRTRSG